MVRKDTAERGFNPMGNTTLTPVRCPICRNVTRVFSRSVWWVCPYCGRRYNDVDKYFVGKEDLRRQLTIGERFSINRLQQELWQIPEAETVIRSNAIVDKIRRGRI